jgi:hypothetical protein
MEEGKTAAISRLQPPPQVLPTVDRMNSLIGDDLFEDLCRAFPTDRSQHQKTTVEPGRKEMPKIQVQCFKIWLAPAQTQQIGAHTH